MTSLNPILARWLDDEPAPRVDCAGCARGRFKCCDFQPFVPNFLVGAALETGRPLPAAAERFRRQPLGLIPTAQFRSARDGAGTPDRCAFFERGACGIWAFRPGECSAYTCVTENHDLAGRAFALETTLAQMALIELGFAGPTVEGQIDILNDPGDALGHADDVEPIYRRAWAWVRTRSRADLAAWLEDL